MFSPIAICVLLCLYTVEGKDDLVWKSYVNNKVPDDAVLIPGQTELYFGLARFDQLEYGISGLLPTTVRNGATKVNLTMNSDTFTVSTEDVDLKVLCGIENSEGKLDFVSTTAEEFSSLIDTNTKPIQVGYELNQQFNATLYAGIVEFDSRDGSHRVVVGKVYEDANADLNYNAFYADLGLELSSSKYDVLVLKT